MDGTCRAFGTLRRHVFFRPRKQNGQVIGYGKRHRQRYSDEPVALLRLEPNRRDRTWHYCGRCGCRSLRLLFVLLESEPVPLQGQAFPL